jgi:hypothetical protein
VQQQQHMQQQHMQWQQQQQHTQQSVYSSSSTCSSSMCSDSSSSSTHGTSMYYIARHAQQQNTACTGTPSHSTQSSMSAAEHRVHWYVTTSETPCASPTTTQQQHSYAVTHCSNTQHTAHSPQMS